MYPSVKSVTPQKNYALQILFENGEYGILEMNSFLEFGVFKKLKNVELFNTAKVSFDTIEWDGGIDLDPQFVYDKTQKSSL